MTTTEKIPFVDYVCDQINQGNFTSASTRCNYLVYGTVRKDQSEEALKNWPETFDSSAFTLNIVPSLFGAKRKVYLSRQGSPYSTTTLKVTKDQEIQLYEAWKVAASIQEERNNYSDAEQHEEYERLHWYP